MDQELATENDIKNFVTDKFKVDFPMFSKIELNGPNAHPVYLYLKYNTPELKAEQGLKNIPWNFTKFLVDRNGKVVGYYPPKIKPVEMTKDILKLL
jgi:glutathione peroxidase